MADSDDERETLTNVQGNGGKMGGESLMSMEIRRRATVVTLTGIGLVIASLVFAIYVVSVGGLPEGSGKCALGSEVTVMSGKAEHRKGRSSSGKSTGFTANIPALLTPNSDGSNPVDTVLEITGFSTEPKAREAATPLLNTTINCCFAPRLTSVSYREGHCHQESGGIFAMALVAFAFLPFTVGVLVLEQTFHLTSRPNIENDQNLAALLGIAAGLLALAFIFATMALSTMAIIASSVGEALNISAMVGCFWLRRKRKLQTSSMV